MCFGLTYRYMSMLPGNFYQNMTEKEPQVCPASQSLQLTLTLAYPLRQSINKGQYFTKQSTWLIKLF